MGFFNPLNPLILFSALLLLLLVVEPTWFVVCEETETETELRALLELKADLDPDEKYLSSWKKNGNPCDGSFEGLACNGDSKVTNISLQGRGLYGKISPSISELKYLTGIYLHYNSLYGEIPKEISSLSQLSELYLNFNNLSGEIPSEIGKMKNLQGWFC